jgi:hypothetical protein
MTRSNIMALLLLAVAVPAAAAAAGSYFSRAEGTCFAAGATGYRLTAKGAADFTIKVDDDALAPDLTLQLVNDPNTADFVLADGIADVSNCDHVAAIRTIRVDPLAREPDLTIALAPKGGRGLFKIYSRSAEFTEQDAAALFAVMWNATRKRVATTN